MLCTFHNKASLCNKLLHRKEYTPQLLAWQRPILQCLIFFHQFIIDAFWIRLVSTMRVVITEA